ncbi:MAG: DUF423 domain-containing protein [Gemmatimonadales bacterium]|nr:MAG: DUF423 domain-containing protein [Gemmatimonadales bacterium]
MSRLLFLFGAGAGFLAVALGAFGAHALRDRLDPRMLEVFEVGVRYQLVHAVLLVVVAVLLARSGDGWFLGAGIALVVGMVFFSGSLYGLSLGGVRWLGAVAPVGGTAFLVGWALLAVGGWRLLGGAGGAAP